VILEEIRMYDDQPPFGADDKCRALSYGSHPLGRSTLGTAESVSAISVEAMRDYHRRRYSPDNIVLAGAGRVDFDALLAQAEQCCASWTAQRDGRQTPPAELNPGFQVLHKDSAMQQYFMSLAAGPSAEDDDRYAAKLLATVLGDDSGSRLYWELVDPGLAEHASLGHAEHQGAGAMITYMVCDPEHAAGNIQSVFDLYCRVEDEGITAEELDQAKNKVQSRIVLGSERPRGRLFALGSDWVYRRQYRPVELDLDMISKITLDDLAAVLAKHPLSRATTVTIGPLAEIVPPK